MGRTTSLTAVALLLVLSGCSGDADPAPAPPSSSAPSSPTASPTPTPPVMPEAAKAHTEAGAKAFVEYFWEVVNYASTTGDTTQIRDLSLAECDGCDGGASAIEKVYRRGGTITGGRASLTVLRSELLLAGKLRIARIIFRATYASQTVDLPGEADDTTVVPSPTKQRMELFLEPEGWRISKLEVLA